MYTCPHTYTHTHIYTHTYKMYIQTHASTPGTTGWHWTCKELLQTKEALHFSFVRRNQTTFHTSNAKPSWYPRPAAPIPLHQCSSMRARRNPSPRMVKVTVHEKQRVNEEQPTPVNSLSRKSRQHGAQTTPAHLHCWETNPPSSWSTHVASFESMLWNRIKQNAPKATIFYQVLMGTLSYWYST